MIGRRKRKSEMKVKEERIEKREVLYPATNIVRKACQ